MKSIALSVLLLGYSCLVGLAAWHLVPSYILWANSWSENMGPLILLPVFGHALLVLLVTAPLVSIQNIYGPAGKVIGILAAAAMGVPITISLIVPFLNGELGPSFVGLGWFVFGGCVYTALGLLYVLGFADPERTASWDLEHLAPEKWSSYPRPGWLNINIEQNLRIIVSRITNQSKLLQAVIYPSFDSVRKDAVEKITDERAHFAIIKYFLAKYALSDTEAFLSSHAAQQITDESALCEIIKKIPNRCDTREICKAAVEKISSQHMLEDIALNARHPYAKELAIGKMTDNAMLLTFARKGSGAAVKAITDTAILLDFAKENDSEISAAMRSMAVERLTEQADFFELAEKSLDPEVRRKAVTHLTGQPELIALAKTSSDPQVRAGAIAKITDLSILKAISKKEKDKKVLQVLCGGEAMKHTVENCLCTRCGAEVHDHEYIRTDKEQISKVAEIQYDLYRCKKCGKTERRNEVGGGID